MLDLTEVPLISVIKEWGNIRVHGNCSMNSNTGFVGENGGGSVWDSIYFLILTFGYGFDRMKRWARVFLLGLGFGV